MTTHGAFRRPDAPALSARSRCVVSPSTPRHAALTGRAATSRPLSQSGENEPDQEFSS
ncbi:hypothetical protein HMPREF0321_1779 [Dermacoccus sp. Ellin185]|nr:hypothetical protein HMPREF0321_1779 [Dermacoccus sp. Ellin185]